MTQEKREAILKHACRHFPPKTKFCSLFGATDIVSDKDQVIVDKHGDCLVLGTSGQLRVIYCGSYWADILTSNT